MNYIVKIVLSANESNIDILNGKIKNWYYSWKNNLITAYSFVNKKEDDQFNSVFNSLRSTKGLNLGLLIDCLTILSNVGVNTDLTISINDNYQLYKLNKKFIVSSIEDIKNNSNLLVMIQNGQGDGEWPIRKRNNIKCNLNINEITISNSIIDYFKSKTRFSSIELKLLNYWRKGIDLENLTFYDESYLAFYKIMEYFGQKANISNSQIPFIYKTDTQKYAYRIAKGTGLKNITKKNIEMLCHFISIRNNWDIAHAKVSSLPKNMENGLYFSYYNNVWDLHHHIKEIARLSIFNLIGLRAFKLIVDGGLYKLSLIKKT